MIYFFKYIWNKIICIPKLIYGIIIFKYEVHIINKKLYTGNTSLLNQISLCNSFVRKTYYK